jgi:hypothetical protein
MIVLPIPLNIPPEDGVWVCVGIVFGCWVGIGLVFVKLLLGGGDLELPLDPPLEPPLAIFILYVMKLK